MLTPDTDTSSGKMMRGYHRTTATSSNPSSPILKIALPAPRIVLIVASMMTFPCLGFKASFTSLRYLARRPKCYAYTHSAMRLGEALDAATRSGIHDEGLGISKRRWSHFATPNSSNDNVIRRETMPISSSRPFPSRPRAIRHPSHDFNVKRSKSTPPFHRSPNTQRSASYPYATLRRASPTSRADAIDDLPAAARVERDEGPTRDDEDDGFAEEEEDDAIFALSSGGGGASVGSGATAVAVIRISGPCAFDALRELLSPRPLRCGVGAGDEDADAAVPLPKLPRARMASLRTLYDPVGDDAGTDERDPLDSALVLAFPGPNSFTGEDVVELHCHGSRAVVQGVLSALSSLHSRLIPATTPRSAGGGRRRRMALRPADPGEFTQRAYASGKLGLVEVEALADLIVADTSLQRRQALRQFDGRLSRLYLGWRDEIIKGLAHAEAVIDFGDDEALDEEEYDGVGEENNDGGMSVWGGIPPRMAALRASMERHLADASRGELLRDGLRVAIVGRPNAGKSSLLNLLAGRDAAIVSSTPGTTRDVVEVVLDLGGVRCAVLDTAGVRKESEEGVNDIELEGMRRARQAARDAHIVVGVVDASGVNDDCERGLKAVEDLLVHDEDEEDGNGSCSNGERKNVLYVLNKLDLVGGEDSGASPISKMLEGPSSFGISCTTSEGVDDLLASLTERALSMVSDESNGMVNGSAPIAVEGTEGAVITRARHRRHVEAASEALARFEVLSGQGYMALDMAAEELRLVASELGRVTGAIDVESVLDVLFADFCIGK